MNFQISGHQTALTSVHFITKYGAASLPVKCARCEWFEESSDRYVSWSEMEHYLRCHWTVI